MNPKNILITGLPRSGTTLVCHLLNKAANTVALHEPLPVFDIAKKNDIEGICGSLDDFFDRSRKSLVKQGTAPSRHVKGFVPDNPFDSKPGKNGLRKSIQEQVMDVVFEKPLDENLVLAVKHTAAFASLLDRLAPRYNCYAVIRNPLSVLMSWQTVDIPINRGRIPAAEAFSPELKTLLDAEKDVLQRQIQIVHWLCGRFHSFLPPEQIICYEEVIESGGACLERISPSAANLKEPLSSKNTNPLYPKALYEKVGKALLSSEGAAWRFYSPQEVEKILESVSSRPKPKSKPFQANFLIIGAQKSGTSALAHFLAQHPEICMPEKKELHFFDSRDFPDNAAPEEIRRLYHKKFPDPRGRILIGEATPSYLFLPFVPQRVHAYNPDIRLICLLRDPVERAWSQYRMERARGTEKRGFWHSVIREKLRYLFDRENYELLNKDAPARRFCYLERGSYAGQLERWLAFFEKSQILVLKTQDLKNNHEKTLMRVYDFLGVSDKSFLPEKKIVFSTGGNGRPGFLTRWMLKLYFAKDVSRVEKMRPD